jgi:hypothetical protein
MRDGEMDYGRYEEAGLLEAFKGIDRQRFPLNFMNLSARLAELGYEVTPSGELRQVSPRRADLVQSSRVPSGQGSVSSETYESLVCFGIASALLIMRYVEYKSGSGDFGPLAALMICMVLSVIPAAIGTRLAFKGAKMEERDTFAGTIAMVAAIASLVYFGFLALVLLALI